MLKVVSKKFNQEGYSDVQAQSHKAYTHLLEVQEQVHVHLRDDFKAVEKQAIVDYKKALETYLCFLRQKANKERWIDKRRLQYKNLSSIHQRQKKDNKVYAIQDSTGQWVYEEQQIKDSFVKFYQDLLGTCDNRCGIKQEIINEGNVLNEEHQRLLNYQFTANDFK